MSGIYIPDMEIPNSCFKGAFNNCPSYADCKALKRFCDNHSYTEIINTIYTGRLEDCPLVEVPPHGDLISKQETVKKLMDAMCKGCKHTDDCGWCAMAEYRRIVEDAPTIIEASEEKR